MMGKDVERILAGINAVKDATISSIISLSNTTAYQITSSAEHAGMAYGHCTPEEEKVPSSASSFVSPIRSAMNSISGDQSNMNALANGLYTSTNSFNNGYGSPWTELNKLESCIKSAETFASAHSSLNWLGEKSGLLGLINMILSVSVDAKWAIITYHDYIQRGYDCVYNGKKPSITIASGIDEVSMGNVSQKYNENVNIQEKTIDPF